MSSKKKGFLSGSSDSNSAPTAVIYLIRQQGMEHGTFLRDHSTAFNFMDLHPIFLLPLSASLGQNTTNGEMGATAGPMQGTRHQAPSTKLRTNCKRDMRTNSMKEPRRGDTGHARVKWKFEGKGEAREGRSELALSLFKAVNAAGCTWLQAAKPSAKSIGCKRSKKTACGG